MKPLAAEEFIKVTNPFPSGSRALADTRHNDQVTAASSTGIDTLDFDEALVVLDVLSITSPGTLDITVMDSSVQAGAAGAATITGATFAQKLLVDAPELLVGRIKTKNNKRFIHVRSVAATASAKEYGVMMILTRAHIHPVSQVNTVEFTV